MARPDRLPLDRGDRPSGAASLVMRSTDVQGDPARVVARKREALFQVRFVDRPGRITTLEGQVDVVPGDAVVTGPAGEEWPVSGDRFSAKYDAVAPTRSGEVGTYRSRPLHVYALRMNRPFEVVLTDAAGSRLTGKAGDWLVDYGDGSHGIVSPTVFDRLYALVGDGDGNVSASPTVGR